MKKSIYLSIISAFVLGICYCVSIAADEMEKSEYRQELYLSDQQTSRDTASVTEQKQYEYETAKTVTDMQGYRVRMEQYLSKTKSNELRIDVYNSRDHRTDTGYRIDTYNADLPTDLSEVVYQSKTQPTWFITDRFTHAENDSGNYFEHFLLGGKLYQTSIDYYQVLYDQDKTSIDGTTKIDIVRVGQDATQNITGHTEFWFPNTLGVLTKTFDSNGEIYDISSYPTYEHTPTWDDVVLKLRAGDPVDLHETTKLGFADGTSLSFERAWIDDNGKIINTDDLKLAREDRKADKWAEIISQWNVENIITASEWGGKNIDIIWSPQNFLAQILSAKK